MAYLYRHIRLDINEVFYIGIGSDNNKNYKRALSIKNRNKHWHNIVNKTDYEVEIMLDDLSWEEACQKEIELISFYGRKDLNLGSLCNYTNGGDGVLGLIMSDESKEKMKKAQTGKKQSKETIKKRSVKLSGVGNPWYGKTFTKEHKEKLSIAKQGKKRSKSVMDNIHKMLCKKVTNDIIIFNSLSEAALYYNVHQTTITRWINKNINNLKFI